MATIQEPGNFTLITPTFEGDVERFALLRRSLIESGTLAPHVAIVNTEDMPQFLRFHHPTLSLIATSDLLPPDIEKRRRASPRNRRIRARVPLSRTVLLDPISGWFVQQVCKITAALAVDTPVAVCIDSDAFVFRALDPAMFETGGRTRFYCAPTFTPRNARFAIRAADFLRMPLDGQLSPHEYISCFVPWSRTVIERMCAHAEQVHGERWEHAFLRTGATEYHSYGVFVNDVEGTRELDVRPDHPAAQYYDLEFLEMAPAALADEWRSIDARVAMVHSKLGVPVTEVDRGLTAAMQAYHSAK